MNLSILNKIDFGASGEASIIQNARFALSTVKNSCPMDRKFGWDPPIDMPNAYAKTSIASQIVEMFEEVAPDLVVADVEFETDIDTGHLHPVVKVVPADG